MTVTRRITHAWVTHATSGAKPAMWSFSFSSTLLEMNMGNAQFFTPIFLILALNQVWISSQINHDAGCQVSGGVHCAGGLYKP